MGRADEDLRHSGASIGTLDHLSAPLRIAAHVDLHELDPLAGEERLGGMAKATITSGIDFNLCHRRARRQNPVFRGAFANPLIESLYMGGRAAAATRANASTLTSAAPARRSARAQASTVAPVVITSSTRIRR